LNAFQVSPATEMSMSHIIGAYRRPSWGPVIMSDHAHEHVE